MCAQFLTQFVKEDHKLGKMVQKPCLFMLFVAVATCSGIRRFSCMIKLCEKNGRLGIGHSAVHFGLYEPCVAELVQEF